MQELELNNFNVKVNTNHEFLFIDTNDYNDLLGEIEQSKIFEIYFTKTRES